MLARALIKIDPDYLIEKFSPILSANGIKITKYWHDDEDIILHIDHKVHLKVKIKILSYKDTFVGFKIKDVVVEKFIKIPGNFIGLLMNVIKGMIEKDFPYAKIKVDGNFMYFENLLSKDIRIQGNYIAGEIFIKDEN